MNESNKPIKYIQMMNSAAHTYGNAITFIQKWLIDLFPKRDDNESVFRTIHVSSKLAHKQIRSSNHEMYKKTKPTMIIRPRVDFNDDRFLRGTPLTDRMNMHQLNFTPSALNEFFFDHENKLAIKYQMNRTVMYADVTLIFSTLIQQLNYATYIKNAISIGHPFDLHTCFESFLAMEMMEVVADVAGIPIKDSNGSVYNFLEYMNAHTLGPVTYKLQGSTQTQEFYRYYPVTIDTMIDSIDVDDGERNGQINDNYQIRFSVRMEFYTTGFYFIFNDSIHKIKHPEFSEDSAIIPVYTDVLLKEDLDLAIGWNLYTRFSCRLEKEFDSIQIESMLNQSIKAAIKYHVSEGIPMDEMIDIKIRRQGDQIKQGRDFTIDYNTLEIKFNNKEFGFFTYTVFVCINIEYINDLICNVFKLR